MSEGEWQKKIKAMIAFKFAGWMQEVTSAFIKFGRIGAETCFGLHRVRPNKLRELFWPSFYSSGKRKRSVGDFARDSPPCPDFHFFP